MKLKHESVTVEMKNGSLATGTVAGVDVRMNIHLSKVRLTIKGRNPVQLD